MKYEWKKQDNAFYRARETPTLITVSKQSCIMISGSGNPNNQDFSDKVAALYALAYEIKIGYKAAATLGGNEVHDFSVYPLKGVWDLKHGDKLIKEELEYTIMIRQPNFITPNMVISALERVKRESQIPCMLKCALTLCKMENISKFCMLVPMMMNLPLLRKWRNLQKIMGWNARKAVIERYI